MSQGFVNPQTITLPLPVAQGGTGVTTSTGSGSVVLGTAPTMTNITSDKITWSDTTKGIVGTTTNNDAAAGYVGETLTSAVPTFTLGITNGVTFNVTSITLTPGDWDVSGSSAIGSNTAVYTCLTAVSSTSATLPSEAYYTGIYSVGAQYAGSGIAPLRRFSVNSNTTIYLVVLPGFTGTGQYAGQIIARRVR